MNYATLFVRIMACLSLLVLLAKESIFHDGDQQGTPVRVNKRVSFCHLFVFLGRVSGYHY